MARRGDPKRPWWLNREFPLTRITNDPETEANLAFSPVGDRLAFLKGRGDLWVVNTDGSNSRRILESWNAPQFTWSPDGKWIAYARSDNDFNRDVWILKVDDPGFAPVNVTRHPANEGNPVWSPDGKILAFTGQRLEDEIDLYWIYLAKADDNQDRRDRTLAKALEKMKQRARSKPNADKPAGDSPKEKEGSQKDEPKEDAPAGDDKTKEKSRDIDLPEVVIDFQEIHRRIRRVSIPNSAESNLLWSPDSKRLAFAATIDGKRGYFTIAPPDETTPKPLSTTVPSRASWLKTGDQIVGLFNGVPGKLGGNGGNVTSYGFSALQEIDRAAKHKAAFDLAWRTMRDSFYDERLGNRNWDEIRRKYADAAATPDRDALATVIQLMLGELNGSHLGFSPRNSSIPQAEPGSEPETPRSASGWRTETAHLGVRFDPNHKGPGLKIRDILPGGPAEKTTAALKPGELILRIDDRPVDPGMSPAEIFNGPPTGERELRLVVADAADPAQTREVTLRPISFSRIRSLLYDLWIKENRRKVEELSEGKFGYLHIQAMNQSSFLKFQEELYSAGSGKEGLVIDVRENGGGSTADLLLTSLTQPRHAITVPRGGGPGYPQDRLVFASWNKPIVVLCNQNSFSNAEIFSHAIKTLKRGQLVGMPTAGGVISTGAASIMDVGTLRLPFRGWYLVGNGEDLELNGAVPDHIVPPSPTDETRGIDKQLEKAVEVLTQDVRKEAETPKPLLRKASERPGFNPR